MFGHAHAEQMTFGIQADQHLDVAAVAIGCDGFKDQAGRFAIHAGTIDLR